MEAGNKINVPSEAIYKYLFEKCSFDDALDKCINLAKEEVGREIEFRMFWYNISNNGYILFDSSNV